MDRAGTFRPTSLRMVLGLLFGRGQKTGNEFGMALVKSGRILQKNKQSIARKWQESMQFVSYNF